jgi:inner membrane protein
MATAVTHFIVGACTALPFCRARSLEAVVRPWGFVFVSGMIAVIPDGDVILMPVVPYENFFGHRGFFHSPFFMILLSALLAGMIRVVARSVTSRAALLMLLVWSGAGISHSILDAMTDGGLGVMMFFPFSAERFFFAWRPIEVAPLGVSRALSGLVEVFPSEIPFCLAALIVGVGGYMAATRRRSPAV